MARRNASGPVKIQSTVKELEAILKQKSVAALKNVAVGLGSDIRKLVKLSLLSNPTLESVRRGQLRIDFGLTEQQAAESVAGIINAITNNVSVNLSKGSRDARIIITIASIKLDELSGVPGASYDSEGGLVDWLNWLLTKGTQVVVEGYEVLSTIKVSEDGEADQAYDHKSRSGGGFMIETGGSYRVDPSHSGTSTDNFVTRSIKSVRNEIVILMKRHLKRAF